MKLSLLHFFVLAVALTASAPLWAQSPQEVAKIFSDSAFKDLLGYRTKWQVKMTTWLDPGLRRMIEQFKKKEELAQPRARADDFLIKQIKALKDAAPMRDSEVEVTAEFESPTRWKITWWHKETPTRYRTEISSDGESGVIIELGASMKNVTEDPWPMLGQYLRGVPSVLAASKIHSRVDLALDGHGNLQLTGAEFGKQKAKLICEPGRFSLVQFIATDDLGGVTERLHASEKNWVWESFIRRRDMTMQPHQRLEWVMVEHQRLEAGQSIFGNQPEPR